MRCFNAVDSIIICVEQQQQTTILRTIYSSIYSHPPSLRIKYDNCVIDRVRESEADRSGQKLFVCVLFCSTQYVIKLRTVNNQRIVCKRAQPIKLPGEAVVVFPFHFHFKNNGLYFHFKKKWVYNCKKFTVLFIAMYIKYSKVS